MYNRRILVIDDDPDIRESNDGMIFGDYPMEGRSVFGEVRLYFR
jgi:hypothetical protein